MHPRLLTFTIALILASFGFERNAEAQHGIPITTDSFDFQHVSPGYAPLYCNTGSGLGADSCDSLAASGNLGVNFTLSSIVLYFGSTVFIGGFQSFKNNTSCNENFVTCSMVSYAAPWKDQNDTPDSLDNLPWGEDDNEWQLTENTCDSCSTGCNYTCKDDSITFEEAWSYYFGCQDINLAPGQSVAINNNLYKVDGPILASLRTFDSTTKPIYLSPNPANPTDTSITTWNYNAMYIDFVKGCNFLRMNGCDFGDEPGQEVEDTVNNYTCPKTEWYYKGAIMGAYHGRSYPTAIASFPIGNQATSNIMDTNNAHSVYQVEFIGSLVGVPAGSELMIYAPEDTSSGSAVIDSGWVWTDTVGDCQSDTLKFKFPFVIPPPQYLDRGMTFIVYFPSDSCSNVGNGKRIYLNGQVMANATTPLYDSGAFMYNAQSVMILDTTPPVITSFIVNPVDSTHLAIQMTGIDDTTMVPFGYIVYSINGGSQQLMPLRFANSLAVGDSTTFVDTLVSPVGHPTIHIKGFVANELGLLDSTAMGTYPLSTDPEDVSSQLGDSLRVNYLLIDHQSKILTLDVQAAGRPMELDLVTEDGRSTMFMTETSSPVGEQKFVQSFSNFANGAYFLVIHSGNESIIENIIL